MTKLNKEQTTKTLTVVLNEVLKASKQADKRASQDINRLIENILPFLPTLQNNITMEGVRGAVYDLVDYNSSDEKMKSSSFEMRVGRAIKRALQIHFKMSVYENADGSIKFENSVDQLGNAIKVVDANDNELKKLGTVEYKEGNLFLPSNALEPKVQKEIKGAKTTVKNTDSTLVPLSSKLVDSAFNEANPSASRKVKSAVQNDNTAEMIKLLSQYLTAKIKAKSSLTCKYGQDFKKLEALLDQYFTQRSTLEVNENEKDEYVINANLKDTKIA